MNNVPYNRFGNTPPQDFFGPQPPPPPPPPVSPTNYGWFWSLLALIGAATGIAALVMSIIALVRISNDNSTSFEALTDFGDESLGNLLLTPCSNETLGTSSISFDSATFIEGVCPESNSMCFDYICQEDGYCGIELTENSTCWRNADCGANMRCDLDMCGCVEDTCETDAQCGIYDANQCIVNQCVDGQCVTNLTMGAECSATSDCLFGFVCNSTCMCEDLNINTVTVSTYTPTFTNGTDNDFVFPPAFLNAVVTDFGEWCQLDIVVQVTTGGGYSFNSASFTFSLPFTANVAENGAGSSSFTRDGGLDGPNNYVFSGVVVIDSATTALVDLNNINGAFVGPSDMGDVYDGTISYIFQKAIV